MTAIKCKIDYDFNVILDLTKKSNKPSLKKIKKILQEKDIVLYRQDTAGTVYLNVPQIKIGIYSISLGLETYHSGARPLNIPIKIGESGPFFYKVWETESQKSCFMHPSANIDDLIISIKYYLRRNNLKSFL